MNDIKISLIASSIRLWLWDEFMESLRISNTAIYEVVFAGDLDCFQTRYHLAKYPELKYVHCSKYVPPAQCYEVARRTAQGELVFWVCDDAEFSPRLLNNVYEFYEKLPSKSLISVKTNENNMHNNLDDHRLLGGGSNSPLMAPLGVMSREYLEKLGGFDRRYLCGQYENKTAMMVYEDGGNVIKYEEGCVYIDHLKKHGVGTKFWTGYSGDRKILESDYVIGEKEKPASGLPYGVIVTKDRLRAPRLSWAPPPIDTRQAVMKSMTGFYPYSAEDITIKNQTGRPWPPEE